MAYCGVPLVVCSNGDEFVHRAKCELVHWMLALQQGNIHLLAHVSGNRLGYFAVVLLTQLNGTINVLSQRLMFLKS